jgi:hypothetical protein
LEASAGMTSIKIGEMAIFIVAFALVPGQIVSYAFPIFFVGLLIRRFWFKTMFVFDGKEHKRKIVWGTYLLLCGIVRLVIGYKDVVLTMQGSWEIACGIAIFVLGPAWWANELMDGSSRGAERSPNSPGPPRGFYFS